MRRGIAGGRLLTWRRCPRTHRRRGRRCRDTRRHCGGAAAWELSCVRADSCARVEASAADGRRLICSARSRSVERPELARRVRHRRRGPVADRERRGAQSCTPAGCSDTDPSVSLRRATRPGGSPSSAATVPDTTQKMSASAPSRRAASCAGLLHLDHMSVLTPPTFSVLSMVGPRWHAISESAPAPLQPDRTRCTVIVTGKLRSTRFSRRECPDTTLGAS